MLQLSRNAGTGPRYLSDVYYHHESESQQTWDTLMQNRVFYNKLKKQAKEREYLSERQVVEWFVQIAMALQVRICV